MPLWELECVKCGNRIDMLTSEMTTEGRNTKVGGEVELKTCEKCGEKKHRRLPVAMARTADKWR